MSDENEVQLDDSALEAAAAAGEDVEADVATEVEAPSGE